MEKGSVKYFNGKHCETTAIKNNAEDYLNPPITNMGYKGILKTSKEIIKWYNTSKNPESEFKAAAMLMEKAGTGGTLFRNLYRDFLKESYALLKIDILKQAHQEFVEIAGLWTKVSDLFMQVSATRDIQLIKMASEILQQLSTREKNTMEKLLHISLPIAESPDYYN